jgi:hypothetical protein
VSEAVGTGECWKFKGFEFLKREVSHKGITPIALDKYIILKSYDELQQLFFMGEEEDHDQEEAVSSEAAAKDEAPTRRHSREEAEDPAPRRSRRTEEEAPVKSDPECPAGMTFGGEDFDSDKKCDDCGVYSDCKAAYRKSKRGD